MSLEISVEHVGEVALCVIAGEVDMATAPRLREALLNLIDSGERHLVLDVEEVPFLDSTGLGVLMEAHRRLQATSGRIVLVGAGSALVRLLTITNLARALPVYRSVPDAVVAIGGQPGADPLETGSEPTTRGGSTAARASEADPVVEEISG